MRPLTELRMKRMLSLPLRSAPLTTSSGSPAAALALSQTVILVPAVTYSPASTTQLSPERDADAGVGAEQGVLADGVAELAAAGQGAHDGGAAADVGAVADDDALRDTAFDH